MTTIDKDISPRGILSNIQQKFPEGRIGEPQLKRIIHTYNVKLLEGMSPVMKLYSHLLNKGYIVRMQSDKSNRIKNIFFTSPGLKSRINNYGRLFMLDCTYNTNRYNMPLLHVLGLLPFGTNFHVCFSFLGDETGSAYLWALEQISSLYEDHTGPSILVTDNELSLKNAIPKVFPNAKHILCKWHIMRHCRKRLNSLSYDRVTKDDLIRQWRLCVDSQSENDFNSNLGELESISPKDGKFMAHLRRACIKHKGKFVSAWIDNFEYSGIRTTSRVEGAHPQIKSCILNRYRELIYTFGRIGEYCKSECDKLEQMVHTDSYSVYKPANVQLFAPLRYKIPGFGFKLLNG